MHESALTSAGQSRFAWRALGSPRLSLLAIVWLLAAVAWSFDQGASATWSLLAPCGLTLVNLLVAMTTRPIFRASLTLLVLHLCLTVIVVMIGISRLTYLRAQAELAEGETFAGALIESEQGPWHPGGLSRLRFAHDGFEIDYAPGRRRADTRHPVRWLDAQGQVRQAVIGDDRPLVLEGYRFYTTPNKGFAPRMNWRAAGQAPVRGTVHLPPYPVYESTQAAQWRPPGLARDLTLELLLDETLIDPDQAATFRLPQRPRLRVRDGTTEVVLAPGESMVLPEGRLQFESMVTWMGYRIDFDPAAPWLLAASVLASLAIGAQVIGRWRARPWNPT